MRCTSVYECLENPPFMGKEIVDAAAQIFCGGISGCVNSEYEFECFVGGGIFVP